MVEIWQKIQNIKILRPELHEHNKYLQENKYKKYINQEILEEDYHLDLGLVFKNLRN